MKPEQLAFIEDVISNHTKSVMSDSHTGSRFSPSLVYLLKGKQRQMCFIAPGKNQSPMSALKTVIARLKPDTFVFCAESWLQQCDTTTKKGKEDMKKLTSGKVRVKDMPEREENLIFTYATMQGEKGMRMFKIERAEDTHRIIDLRQRDDADCSDFVSDKMP
jgi:hypothetical protein